MRRPARANVYAVTALSLLSSCMALTAAPTFIEANTPLTAVLKHVRYVFASTPDGLFRAPLETKRWERIKTPSEMPLNGNFASQPGPSPVVLYVAMRSETDRQPRRGSRYGLYLSRDDGARWELISERDDFGATLLHPSGALFAVTGEDGINHGGHVVRSTDLGKTWRDITGGAHGQFLGLAPDPDHPGLVRIHAWSIRDFTLVAADENYVWKYADERVRGRGKRPSDEFFARVSFSTEYYFCEATLANYFRFDFGNQTEVPALEVIPQKARFEFARGARVVVPVRVVVHFDPDVLIPESRKLAAEGRPYSKLNPPTIKFADQTGRADFWGLRVETSDQQTERHPPEGPRTVTITTTSTPDGGTVSSRYQPAAVKHQVVNLSPSSPYERELDLGRLSDFSRPGEYRVQIIYDSGGHPEREKGEWDGGFTSPVFTVVIGE